MSVAKFSQKGDASQPSPAIWRDCRMGLLNDLGLGRYLSYHGQGVNLGTFASSDLRPTIGDFEMKADDDVVVSNALPTGIEGGRTDFQLATTDEDEVYIVASAGQGIVINSGLKVWFEAMVQAGATGADSSFFMGIQEEVTGGLAFNGGDAIQDAGLLLAAESSFGHFQNTGDKGAVDAVFTLDAAAHTVVLADETRSTAFTDGGGTAADFPVADVYHKFGLRFNGIDQMEYYVDGILISSLTLVSGTHPVGVAMGPIIGFKNGDGGVKSFNVKFMKYAEQVRT